MKKKTTKKANRTKKGTNNKQDDSLNKKEDNYDGLKKLEDWFTCGSTRKQANTVNESRDKPSANGIVIHGSWKVTNDKINKIILEGKEFNISSELVDGIKKLIGPPEPITYEECKKIFNNSSQRDKQLTALCKMMIVADVLNGDWKWNPNAAYGLAAKILWGTERPFAREYYYSYIDSFEILFKDKLTAERAIKILGEDVIKTAYGL